MEPKQVTSGHEALLHHSGHPLRVLIVVENMSYTYDTRIRNIARTLVSAGCRVAVICPRYPGDPLRQTDGEIAVTFYPLPPAVGGFVGHVIEYVFSFLAIALLSLTTRFDVIHICNPPDIFFPLGWLHSWLGRRFVFDLHDLCPELWQARYRKWNFVHRLVLGAERATLRAATHVLVTSETARQRILRRAPIKRERITLVCNGPDIVDTITPKAQRSEKSVIEVGYLGTMNPQDGIDTLLLAAHHIRHTLGRADIRFVCIGDGSAYDGLRAMAVQLNLRGVVHFTGRLPPRQALERIAACDLCVQPDPKNPFTDSCIMVKSLEYMALGKALVAFDLQETRRVCSAAALYAKDNSFCSLADEILRLADNQTLRHRLGQFGRRLIEGGLAWSFFQDNLLNAYRHLTDHEREIDQTSFPGV